MTITEKPYDLIRPFHTLESLRLRIGWFVNLRWIAIIGLLCAVPIAERLLGFNLAFDRIYLLAALLTVLNIIYFFLCKYLPFKSFYQEIFFTETQVLGDYIILSFLIHYTGGITNPFYFLYIVHIIISGILFHSYWPYLNATVAAFLLTLWSGLEYFGVVNIYSFSGLVMPGRMYLISLMAFYLLIYTAAYIIKDIISGYRHLKHVIDEKSALLEQTILERDRMFRFTAHELKSPLTTLRSMLAVIDEVYTDSLQPSVREMLGRAVRRTDQLLMMVKEMIEVTQYKHGLAEYHEQTVDFRDWICQIISQQQAYADEKKINLQVLPLEPTFTISMDTTGLEKVLSNLVNNALRYSPTGARVTVKPFVGTASFGFEVSDTGIGIAAEDIPKIFEEFFRSANAREMESLGTGLGLCLVKQIVEKLGGQINVASQIGQGTTFTVVLPRRDAE